MAKTPAWQRAEGKNPKGGLNEKGRASLKAEGHDIKRPQPEGGSRRDSFCARMKGMKKKLTSAETANDPDSRINKSLRAWNCADGGAVDPYAGVQQAAKGGEVWNKPRPKKLGKPEPLSSKEKASAKAAAKAAGRPYPNLIDNMRAARADGGEAGTPDFDPYDDVQRAAEMGATPAVPPVSVTEHAAPSTPALDAYRGAINEAVPLPARALVSGMMGVHSPMTEQELAPSDREEIIRQTEAQRAQSARAEANLAQEYAGMTPDKYQHQVAMEVRDPLPYEMYKNQTLRDLESFERTRGKNSIFYDESLQTKDPEGDRGRGINVYNPENAGAFRAAERAYSEPAYRVGMTLGRYNVYDTPQGRIVADNYDFNRSPAPKQEEVGLSDYYKGFMPALRKQINFSFPNINRPVAMNLDAKPNTSYTYTGQPFTTPGSNVHRLATKTLDQDAMIPGMLGTGQTPGDTRSDVTPRLSVDDADVARVLSDRNPPLPPRRPAGLANGGAAYPLADRQNWTAARHYDEHGGKLTHMSPDQFLHRSRHLDIDGPTRDSIDRFKAHMARGHHMNPLQLLANGLEDGRHRATAAKELGIKSVPVVDFRADGGPVDDRAHEFVQEQLQSGEPQVPQYVAENDFPARAARGIEAADTAAARVNNLLAGAAGMEAMRSPEGREKMQAINTDRNNAIKAALQGDQVAAFEKNLANMPQGRGRGGFSASV